MTVSIFFSSEPEGHGVKATIHSNSLSAPVEFLQRRSSFLILSRK
jgi:hypothetical protein